MSRVYISPSMQTENRYNYGNTNEEAECRRIGDALARELSRCGVAYILGEQDQTLTKRCQQSNSEKCTVHLSIHTNAAGNGGITSAQGCEVLFYGLEGGKSHKACLPVYNALIALGLKPRGLKPVNPGWVEPKATNAATVYVEVDFHDNPTRAQWITEHTAEIAAALARGLCEHYGVPYIPADPAPPIPDNLTPIYGSAVLTAPQMRAYLNQQNPAAPDYADLYLQEGAKEGIRGDIAFAQSCLETGHWRFGGDVSPEQNNFCGLGATGGGEPGNRFPTPHQGIRAQVQHLKAYACDLPLAGKCVDPRFTYVSRGEAPYVEWLGIPDNPTGKGWAAGEGYGERILTILQQIAAAQPAPPAEPPSTDYKAKYEGLVERLQKEIATLQALVK